MTFLIITHVLHKECNGKYFAYGPYVKEMNLWLKYPEKVILVAPLVHKDRTEPIDLEYKHDDIIFFSIPEFNLKGINSILSALVAIPRILIRIARGINLADHIHIRCPGNIGLLGCIAQVFFPYKVKTAKYAGNWDWNSKQPWSYRLQQRILRNTFLTRNMTVLVYGDWPDKTKNIKPFFTASYSEKDRASVRKPDFKDGVNLAFIGGLYEFKNPLKSLEVLNTLVVKGINAKLTYCGDGPEREKLEQKGRMYGISDRLIFTGNVNSEKVKEVLQEAHFLVFISRSEGWPKAVAEAMWWGCLPITSKVSCLPNMLGEEGSRGNIVTGDINEISELIKEYLSAPALYKEKTQNAMEWSRTYTLELLEEEIVKLLK